MISKQQIAFILGRLLIDNAFIALEICLHINSLRGRREGVLAIKMDMMKAYDRVKWNFLCAVMCNFGFPDRWIHLIMSCVELTSFLALING